MRRRSSRHFYLALSLAAITAPLSAQDLRVSAGTIEDRRTTGQFFGGLEVELKLTGDDLADAKASRVLLKKAVDETGRDLLPDEKKEPDFSTSGSSGLKVNLKNPPAARPRSRRFPERCSSSRLRGIPPPPSLLTG